MFGNIIEKILKRYLGDYLDGMFSGKFKELIDELEWPIQLEFSFVETFEVNFQIKNFRSKPFRIEMSNIFMLVKPKEKKDWDLEQFNKISYKQKQIDTSIKKFIEDQAKEEQQKQLKQGEDKGWSFNIFDQIIAVVIDNIEICIKNVHFRFESSSPVYAWGITIGKIEAFTMSKDWQQKKFIDRMNIKNKDEAINKLITVKNVGFYWENSSAEMFSNQSEGVIVEKMYEYVLYQAQTQNFDLRKGFRSTQYIVCLNVDLHLTINSDNQSFGIPEFQMKVSFENIDINIGHEQLKGMLSLSTLLSNYQYCIRSEKDKVKLFFLKPDYEEFKNQRINMEQLKVEIDKLKTHLEGLNKPAPVVEKNQIYLGIEPEFKQRPQSRKQTHLYTETEKKELQESLKNKERELGILKLFYKVLMRRYWSHYYYRVKNINMEKHYKEILKKILQSKYPSIKNLLEEEDFTKILQNNILDKVQVQRYLDAINTNDVEDLVRWSKISQDMIGIQKQYEKNKKEQKKNKKVGLFGWQKKNDSDDEDDDEIHGLSDIKSKVDKQKILQELEYPILFNRNGNVRPKEYVWMKIEVQIIQGSIQISEIISIEQGKNPKYHDRHNKIKQIEEGLRIQWDDISFEMLKRDTNFTISTKLRDLQMFLFTKQQDTRNQVMVQILKKVETINQDKKPLVYIRFEKQPFNKPQTFFVLEAELQQILFTYYPQKLHRIQAWLEYQTQVDLTDQNKHVEQQQHNQEEYEMSLFKKEQFIVMRAPIIVIPLNQQSSNESECLVINFQELKFQTIDEQSKIQRSFFNASPGANYFNSGHNMFSNMSPHLSHQPLSRQQEQSKIIFPITPSKVGNVQFQFPPPQQSPTLQGGFIQIPSNIKITDQQAAGSSLVRQQSKTLHSTKKNQPFIKGQKNESTTEQIYDYYKVEATGITVSYFSSINHMNNHLRFKNSTKYDEIVNNPIRKKGVIHDIVEKFNFSLELGLQKDFVTDKTIDTPKILLRSDISNITLNLTSYLYFNLKNISELFQTEEDITKVQEFLQLEKEILIKFSQEKGNLMKRGDTFKSWANYYVIFSGNFLYFFNNKNDDYYTYHIYFKHAILKTESSNEIGVPHCIKLIVKNKEIYLAANNYLEYKKWLRVLTRYQTIIHEEKEKKKKFNRGKVNSDAGQLQPNNLERKPEHPQNIDVNELDIRLNISKVNIQIHQEFKKKSSLFSVHSNLAKKDVIDDTQWLDITLEYINLMYTSREVETNLKINLGSIKVIDPFTFYPQGYIQSVAQSYPFIEEQIILYKNKVFILIK